MTFKFFAVETKKSRKEGGIRVPGSMSFLKDSKTSAASKEKFVSPNAPLGTLHSPLASSCSFNLIPCISLGYSPPKLVGEVILEFAALDDNSAKENWYPFSVKHKKDRKVRRLYCPFFFQYYYYCFTLRLSRAAMFVLASNSRRRSSFPLRSMTR